MRLDVRVRVRKAFYDLLRTQDELRIHDGHVAIARQAVEAARIKYTVGKVPQQDILKAQAELTRLSAGGRIQQNRPVFKVAAKSNKSSGLPGMASKD